MNIGSTVASVFACIAVAAGLIFGISSCTTMVNLQTQKDQESRLSCIEHGGQWIEDGSALKVCVSPAAQ